MKEYTQTQQQEIVKGITKGLDVSMYSNPDFYAAQMHEIRKGMEEGLDVSLYADLKYNFLQMREIRFGLLDNLDVSLYAKPEFTNKTMFIIRQALESDIDVERYLQEGYVEDQLEEIRLALSENLPIDRFVEVSFHSAQIREIRLGLESRVDVSLYAKEEFNWMQMAEIRMGLESQIDATMYLNVLYNSGQMQQIRLGMEQGLDVTEYARLMFTAKEMYKRRNALLEKERMAPRPAVRGEDGYYEYFFDADATGYPPVDTRGQLDFEGWDPFRIVEAGTKVAVYHRAKEGTPGRDEEGNLIPARKGNECQVLKGTGFLFNAEELSYTAALTGRIFYHKNILKITPILIIEDNLTDETEGIRFNGDVLIKGSVSHGGSIVATGDVMVLGEFEVGRIIAGGNIYVCEDAVCNYQGVLQAKGSIYGKSFTAAKLTAEKSIYTNRLVKTDAVAREKIRVAEGEGEIVGGTVCAERGIDVKNIGNAYREETKILIGYSSHTREREEELTAQYERISSELERLEEAERTLRERVAEHKIVKDGKIEQLLGSLEDTHIERVKERNEIFGRRQILVKMRERVNSLPVRIKGTAHCGSSIRIDNETYFFYKDKDDIILQKRNGTILVRNR